MKISEFRKLIREEVRKIIKEGNIDDLRADPKDLKLQDYDFDLETQLKEIEDKYKLKLIKTVKVDGDWMPIEISQIIGTSYIVVKATYGSAKNKGSGMIFNAADMTKVEAAIKDGSFTKLVSSEAAANHGSDWD